MSSCSGTNYTDCAAAGGRCSAGATSCDCNVHSLCGSCAADTDCASGLVCDTDAGGQCQITACNTSFTEQDQCDVAGGSGCNPNSTCACPVPQALCTSCSSDAQCASGLCGDGGICQTTTCAEDAGACLAAGGLCGVAGSCNCSPTVCSTCAADSDCLSGYCDVDAGICQTTHCGTGSDVCPTGQCALDGGPCLCNPLASACSFCGQDSDCYSGFCDSNGQCNTHDCATSDCLAAGYACTGSSCNCTASPLCGGCGANSDCASGICDLDMGGICETNDCPAQATVCADNGGFCTYVDGGLEADGGAVTHGRSSCACFADFLGLQSHASPARRR